MKKDAEKPRGTKAEPKRLISVNPGGMGLLDDGTELRVAPDDLTRVNTWQPYVQVRVQLPSNPASRPFQLMINQETGEAANVILCQSPDDPFSQLVRRSKQGR
jgi:hypothetical protein